MPEYDIYQYITLNMQGSKHSKIKTSDEVQFKEALLDFQKIKQQNIVPQKMILKLSYLENKLLGRKIILENYNSLPSYELASLEQCDHNIQMKLFASIVRCLSGKQIIIYFNDQKAYFRKDQMLARWKKCYISCDSNLIKLKKKISQSEWMTLNIKDIRISSKYKIYKGKVSFGFIHQTKKYFIGFDHESACQRIHHIIRQLSKQIQQRKNQKKQSFNNLNSQKMMLIDESKPFRTFNNNRDVEEDMQFYDVKKPSLERDLQFQRVNDFGQEVDLQFKHEQQLGFFQQQIKKETFSSDKNYKLIRNFELGRILLSQIDYKIKLSALMQVEADLQWILQQYLNMKNWNLQVQEFKIINKISLNSYKAIIQFKKYSLISYSRWACVTITAVPIDKKMYLVIRDCLEDAQNQKIGSIRMSFEQTVELCKRHDKDSRTLMTIITKTDFGGYCTQTDNINMSIKILENIQNFYNFLLSQTISEKTLKLFDFQNEILKKDKHLQKSRRSSLKSSCTFSEQSQKDSIVSKDQQIQEKQYSVELKKTITHLVKQKQQFVQQLRNYQRSNKQSPQLVELILKKCHESYYLDHKFISNDPLNESQKYNNSKQDNFITQKGKWKISMQDLIFIDQEVLSVNKNVVKLILKQISTNVMSGKNIMNMSLPVQIFDNMSFLQKIADGFGFLPHFFKEAAEQTNIVKQIQLVANTFFFTTPITPNIQKPFNPILGETYQSSIGGVDLCLEQISHHPPISAFFLKNQDFECYGNYSPNVQMGLNTVVAKNHSCFHVKFYKTNTKYKIIPPDYQMSGIMFGDRKVRMTGKGIVFEQVNDVLCEVSFGKTKKKVYQLPRKIRSGQIVGGIYKVSQNFAKRLKNFSSTSFEGVKYDQLIQELAKITGNWLGQVYVDQVMVKDMLDPAPYKHLKMNYVIPSDCSFRLDAYYKRVGKLKESQQQKQNLEDLQRRDRKLRQQWAKRKI